jgi:hypothetical protein
MDNVHIPGDAVYENTPLLWLYQSWFIGTNKTVERKLQAEVLPDFSFALHLRSIFSTEHLGRVVEHPASNSGIASFQYLAGGRIIQQIFYYVAVSGDCTS